MRKLILLGVVVAILGVADVTAKAYVETGIESSLRRELQGVGDVDASISSFPFVGRLFAVGDVSHIRLRLSDVTGRDVPVARFQLDVDGLRIDRSSVVDHNQIRITGVDSVRITVALSRDDLEAVLGPAAAALELIEGATLRIVEGRLELAAGISIPVPAGDLLPCDASATVGEDEVLLACESDRLPQIIVEAIGSVNLREQLGLE